MNMKKIVAAASALSLTAAVAVGGTLAWLQDDTVEVVNTFTWSKDNAIQLTLDESVEPNFSIVPGGTDVKDPTLHLTTKTDSYLYVVIDVDETLNGVVSITGLDNWTEIPDATLPKDVEGTLYYYTPGKVAAAGSEQDFPVFTGVKYADDLKYDENTELTGNISIKGFAVQASAGKDAQAAWTATFGAPQA